MPYLTCTSGFTPGRVMLKRFGGYGAAPFVLLNFAVFSPSSLACVRSFAHGPGEVVSLLIIGALIFGARFSASQIAGLARALLKLWLFAHSDHNKL